MTHKLEGAHLRGHIYQDRGRWRCTSHGGALAAGPDGVLRSDCCALEVKP